MKHLKLRLMQFLLITNVHFHKYFNAVLVITWTVEAKNLLLTETLQILITQLQTSSFKRGKLKGLNDQVYKFKMCLTL